ncbi:MAG: phasin family protein [Endomicrobium sp.]|jgi:polyhydroxyalkanoate synthesis regulator phasin|nr:phasin family protein [Endomicrobium sp.]
MKNLKSVFYAGIGLALKGKSKIEKMAKQFVKENKLGVAEGKKFIEKAIKQAEDTKKELSRKIHETVRTTISQMGIITNKEIARLNKELENLKAQIHKSAKTKKNKK